MSGRLSLQWGLRHEQGQDLAMLWWSAPEELRMVSTSLIGGGIGPCRWFLNAQVPAHYDRGDPEQHVMELAALAGLDGPGAAMITAVDVREVRHTEEDGVQVLATVGLGWPTWAAAPAGAGGPAGGGGPAGSAAPVGTVNLFVVVPAPVSDAALVNLVTTVAEAKAQALFEAGVAGTGTASDAVCVAVERPRTGKGAGTSCQSPGGENGANRFGGPRSYWGSRVARAVHRAVAEGALADRDGALARGWPRP